MENALWITLIGMGLVFAAILLLWGLMALLVHLTREPEQSAPAPVIGDETSAGEETPGQAQLIERKHRAAAAAVAAAFSMRNPNGAAARPLSTPASVSAWQAVHRASQISQRVNPSRKKVAQ